MSIDIPLQFDPAASPDIQHGLHVFADGCFEPGSGYGGWAFVAYRDAVEIESAFGGIRDTDNNAMELTALLQAAAWINSHAACDPAVIWSDSVYAVRGCNQWRPIWKNNGWKKIGANTKVRNRTIANPELWKAIDHQLQHNDLMTIAWCKGHSGIAGNELADRRADQGRLSMEKRSA
ncbi:ribonuclease H [Rhizobium sp. PL01]|uniref:ribonuclease H family protein n=1 Tax=Rhizobium sp. PL01 TaxID=3085631 RepID=UPI002981BB8E|nr:ribonuclease H [Rhizobium sp. PL01]MDW5313250.1 ribonuclease H [Rhizobium sp. PL01]